jgi:hypothetical protein
MSEELNKLAREPGHSIRITMGHLAAIANSLYKGKTEPEKGNSITRVMMEGMVNFTVGKTREEVLAVIEYCKQEAKPINWEKLLTAVIAAEKVHGTPAVALKYNTAMNPSQRLYNVGPVVSKQVKSRPMTVNIRNTGRNNRKTNRNDTITDTGTDTWNSRDITKTRKKEHVSQNRPEQDQEQEQEETGTETEPEQEILAQEQEHAQGRVRPQLAESSTEMDDTEEEEQPPTVRVTMRSIRPPARYPELDTIAKRLDMLQISIDKSQETQQFRNSTKKIKEQGKPRESRYKDNKYQKEHKLEHYNDRNNYRNNSEERPGQSRNQWNDNRNSPRDRSWSQNRGTSRDRNSRFGTSRDRNSRFGTSRDRNSRFGRSRDRRSRNRNSFNYSDTEGRSSSRGTVSQERYNTGTRSSRNGYRSRNTESRGNTYEQRNSRSMSGRRNSNRTPERGFGGSRGNSRGREWRQRERSWNAARGDLERGINCSANYNPETMKLCMKCVQEHTHHEFQCPTYRRRGLFKCNRCKRGYHFTSECKEELSRNPSKERLLN